MKTIAIYHNKGGVGKTTIAINLAAALSRQCFSVLVIDLDGQANTTYAAGLVGYDDIADDEIIDAYIFHVLTEELTIDEVIRESQHRNYNFDVIPSHIKLTTYEIGLNQWIHNATGNLFRLDQQLTSVEHKYDVVIIDAPPALNIFARVALVTANYLIIPSDLKPFSNRGLLNVIDFIETEVIPRQQQLIDKDDLEILGVLPSKLNTNNQFITHTLPRMLSIVEERYDLPLFNSQIFERREISAATEKIILTEHHIIPDPQSIFSYKPNSQAATEFENLANEVIQRIDL